MHKALRLAAALLTAAGGVLSLAGCGFTPLYASPGVVGGLSAIEVTAPPGRVAFLLREDLDDVLAHDRSLPPAWRLTFTVTETRDPRGLSRDDVADRYALGMTVRYALTSVATGSVAQSGEVVTQVSYDAADAPYAGIAARQNSQERAASDAARRIEIQLAAWLARQSHP
jgi:LPS-assembly lipoprotein